MRTATEIAARVAELERQREVAGYADDRHRIYVLAAALAEHVWYAAGSTPPVGNALTPGSASLEEGT